MMCPGKEFGIMDATAGLVFGVGTYFLRWLGAPWYFWLGLAISTIAWFAMAIHCFRFAAKCNCQEIYKSLGIK